MRTLFIILLFGTLAILEYGLLSAMPEPYSLIPLMLIAGILLYQQASVFMGLAWFGAVAFIGVLIGFNDFLWWQYILIALASVQLVRKIFSNRSIYALIGFGMTFYFGLVLLRLITRLAQSLLGLNTAITAHYSFFLEVGTLIVGLVIGFVIARYVTSTARTFFYIRKDHV